MSNESSNLGSDEAFAELLAKAKPRIRPPADVEAEIRSTLHAEWQDVVSKHSRRRQFISLAAAASVLIAVFVALGTLRSPLPGMASPELATVAREFGEVSVTASIEGSDAHEIDDAINTGDVVRTGIDSGLALAWHGGGSLRIDAQSMVVFESENRVYVQEGSVYFDSVDSGSVAVRADAIPLSIRTDVGVIRHIGTQYMTTVDVHGTTVAVREGRVAIDGVRGGREASAGEQVAISGSGNFSGSEVSAYDSRWAWVQETAPSISLDGRPVSEALDWVQRESGLRIEFAGTAAADIARDSNIRGLPGDLDLTPLQALNIFMPLTGLDARIRRDEGKIIVGLAL